MLKTPHGLEGTAGCTRSSSSQSIVRFHVQDSECSYGRARVLKIGCLPRQYNAEQKARYTNMYIYYPHPPIVSLATLLINMGTHDPRQRAAPGIYVPRTLAICAISKLCCAICRSPSQNWFIQGRQKGFP